MGAWKNKKRDYKKFVKEYAEFLSKKFENLIVTPDKDRYYGINYIKNNFPRYNIKPINENWYKLNADLTKQTLTIICLGLSPGVLIEGGS